MELKNINLNMVKLPTEQLKPGKYLIKYTLSNNIDQVIQLVKNKKSRFIEAAFLFFTDINNLLSKYFLRLMLKLKMFQYAELPSLPFFQLPPSSHSTGSFHWQSPCIFQHNLDTFYSCTIRLSAFGFIETCRGFYKNFICIFREIFFCPCSNFFSNICNLIIA
jgi:hypothetical protein